MNIYVVHYKNLLKEKNTENEFKKYSFNLIFKTDFDKRTCQRNT